MGKSSPPKVVSPPTIAVKASPPRAVLPKVTSPPLPKITSPPLKASPPKRSPPPATPAPNENSVAARASRIEAAASPPKKDRDAVTSPPVSAFKINRSDSKNEDSNPVIRTVKRENSAGKEVPLRAEKLSLVATTDGSPKQDEGVSKAEEKSDKAKNEESNGVGDKIKKFEKAAEDASVPAAARGTLARAGSVRRRDEFPPPATPYKDGAFSPPATTYKDTAFSPPVATYKEAAFSPPAPRPAAAAVERQQSLPKAASPALATTKWHRSESHEDRLPKPEPQKIIKPEFKPMASPVDATIRSPSLGAKLPDQFSSHGTAFRNVASPDQPRTAPAHKCADDAHNSKPCKLKQKKEYSVSKGSSYFTRGSEEIWLVKKKDIEEIEERVLDSLRRAGGAGGGGGGGRPASAGATAATATAGATAATAATLGRVRRGYARSESLDPGWAGPRAATLKRQTSVACTCGHDKKPKPRAPPDQPRPRSRSHGDDAHHVLDKYETLV